MNKVEIYVPGQPVPKYHKKCGKCEGDRVIQSDNGSQPIECPKCEGTGLIKNPFRN